MSDQANPNQYRDADSRAESWNSLEEVRGNQNQEVPRNFEGFELRSYVNHPNHQEWAEAQVREDARAAQDHPQHGEWIQHWRNRQRALEELEGQAPIFAEDGRVTWFEPSFQDEEEDQELQARIDNLRRDGDQDPPPQVAQPAPERGPLQDAVDEFIQAVDQVQPVRQPAAGQQAPRQQIGQGIGGANNGGGNRNANNDAVGGMVNAINRLNLGLPGPLPGNGPLQVPIQAGARAPGPQPDYGQLIARVVNSISQHQAMLQTYIQQQGQMNNTVTQAIIPAVMAANKPKGAPQNQAKSQLKLVQINQSSCSSQQFMRFQRIAYLAKEANNWSDQQLILHVLGNLIGPAADCCRSLSSDVKDYASITEFFKKVRERFVTVAHTGVARQRFAALVQEKDETIRAFHARLHTAWHDAYAEDDEPWLFNATVPIPFGRSKGSPGNGCQRLIDAFLNGLRSEVIRVQLRNTALLNNRPYVSYADALKDALNLNFSLGQVASERNRFYLSDRSRIVQPTYDTHKVHHQFSRYSTPRTGRNDEVPMEIGLAKKGKGKKGPARKKPKARLVHTLPGNQGNNVAYCKFHKTDSHSDSTCRAQQKTSSGKKSEGQNKGQWQSANKPKSNSNKPKNGPSNGLNKQKIKCFNCQKMGHFAKECRSPKQEHSVHAVGQLTRFQEN